MTQAAPFLLPRLRWRALVASAALAAAGLLALVLLQLQQLERLNQALHDDHEARTVYMYRQLIEYLDLREQWALALNGRNAADLRTLTQRYEIWVGRIGMLREDTAVRQMTQSVFPELDATLARVDAFVRAADPVVAGTLPDPARRDALADLHPQLVALGDAMRELPLAAAHRASRDQVERTLTLGRYSRIALAATALLALMTLAFAMLAWRQMLALRQRQAALEALTAELARARLAAEEGSRAKSHFLANMSHEIRTPFQGLLGMLGMLRSTALDARQLDYLRTATESADHLLAVLSDILDLSQLEAGRLRLNSAPVVLRKLLQEVEMLMRTQASQRHLALHVDVNPAVPEHVSLDATRVKQVLLNLLSNAIKFTAHGSVELAVGVQDAGSASQRLVFAVTDTGPGMDAPTLARIFNRFERADTAAQGVEGSGLGLPIARSLAQLMDGDLHAASSPGKGSRFTFELPLVSPPAEPAATPLQTHEAPAAPPLLPLQRLQVLVAEDHAVNRQVIAALLESLGHEAQFVADGEQAVATAQTRAFDLVLMDLHMPAVDGIEATRRIRALADRRAATTPIVALTADAFTDTRERCLVAGMNGFLTKPVGRDKLATLLRQLFGSDAAQPQPASAAGPAAGSDPSTAPTPPLLDAEAIARTVQLLTVDRYAHVLTLYFEQAGQTVELMRNAVRDAQPLALRTHAHATRGAALNLGLPALAAVAKALQDGAAHLPAHEIARLVQQFADLVPATRAASAALLPGAARLPG